MEVSPEKHYAQLGQRYHLKEMHFLGVAYNDLGNKAFGAAASVWNFNGAGDVLQHRTRALLWLVGADNMWTTLTGSRRMTWPTPPTPPSRKSSTSSASGSRSPKGVLIAVTRKGVALSPTPSRIQKLTAMIRNILEADACAPEQAQRLAAKINFLNQAVFGKMDNTGIYADAFFLEGETRHKAGYVPLSASATDKHKPENGWGYVVRI